MTKEGFAVRLKNACACVAAAEGELTEIDSHFGDADHGLTMSKIAKAISDAVEGRRVPRPAKGSCPNLGVPRAMARRPSAPRMPARCPCPVFSRVWRRPDNVKEAII